MAVKYRVYSNDLAGGPVLLADGGAVTLALQDGSDLALQDGSLLETAGSSGGPVADGLTGLTYQTAPLPSGARASYLVRSYDDATGLEYPSLDSRADIVIDASGVDRSNAPAPPSNVVVQPLAGGKAKVSWSYLPSTAGALPASFSVWLGAGATVDFSASAVASVPYQGPVGHSATLSGLSDGVDYAVGVRAVNSAGDDGNTASYPLTVDATPPQAVDQLAASAVWAR